MPGHDTLGRGSENGGMFVSMEVIAMIGSVVTIIIAMFSCFGWFLNRMDARIAQLDVKFDARIDELDPKFDAVDARFDALDAKFDSRIDRLDAKFEARFAAVDTRFDAQDVKLGARFDRVDDRVSALEHEVSEVKVAIARLEGPPRHLIPVR